ncbi:erythromycin esterase family protein [Rufibacter sp. LB8]|uniref:erythromycin esterase family protein n=1 Tax=Rufibacter sp. LB8 TaxID=2777781 RepID=UPI00178C6B8C|nr:erythromycin esterase family protein [Rufibacter sp. LB8]
MKKVLKKIALFLVLTPVVLLLLAGLAYVVYGLVAVGGESTPHQAYLNQHKQNVSFSGTPSFPIFDEAFYQNQVFFLGEAHGTAAPQELDFALLQHLHQKVGLRYYLAEVDQSQAYFLNQYLRTGQEENLQQVFNFWAKINAQWGNQNFYDKVKKIHAFNQTLPQDQQIQFLGIDRIQDTETLHLHLKTLLPETASPELSPVAQLIDTDTLNLDSLVQAANQVLPGLTTDTANADLRHTLQNVVYLDQKVKRDSVMYLNLHTLVQEQGLQQEKLYGMWGIFHTIPVKVERGLPLAYLLQQPESSFKGKTVSIGVYTLDSESMMPAAALPAFLSKGQRFVNTTWANNDGPMVFVNGIKDLRAAAGDSPMTMFKTDAAGSPYLTSTRLASFEVLMPNQSIAFAEANPSITKVFPYVCLVQKSEATTPYTARL